MTTLKRKPANTLRTARVYIFTRIGIGSLMLGGIILFAIFWPIMSEELKFGVKRSLLHIPPNTAIVPVDADFGIVIPKIEANAKIIPNVDPFNSRIYQTALTRGVAHAKDTGVPGQPGNIFLFSHSSANFYEAKRYNSIFYLLSKLQFGDEIDLYYKGTKYTYRETSKKTVAANAIQYLKPMEKDRETLTLMTCWPPGTSYQRLLIIAERKHQL